MITLPWVLALWVCGHALDTAAQLDTGLLMPLTGRAGEGVSKSAVAAAAAGRGAGDG